MQNPRLRVQKQKQKKKRTRTFESRDGENSSQKFEKKYWIYDETGCAADQDGQEEKLINCVCVCVCVECVDIFLQE